MTPVLATPIPELVFRTTDELRQIVQLLFDPGCLVTIHDDLLVTREGEQFTCHRSRLLLYQPLAC